MIRSMCAMSKAGDECIELLETCCERGWPTLSVDLD